MMEDQEQHEEEELNNTGIVSARKAAILQAESLLSKHMGSSSNVSKSAQATALAHSIRTKRKMDSMYILGKALSSRTRSNQDTVTKSEARNQHHDPSPKPAPRNQNMHTPGEKSDPSFKDQTPHLQQTHHRSFYCEEFNMASASNHRLDSQPSDAKSSSYQSSHQKSSAHLQNNNLQQYLNQSKQPGRKSVGALNQSDRRFKVNEVASLKVITDV